MTPDGYITLPIDKAANRELILSDARKNALTGRSKLVDIAATSAFALE